MAGAIWTRLSASFDASRTKYLRRYHPQAMRMMRVSLNLIMLVLNLILRASSFSGEATKESYKHYLPLMFAG